MKCRLERDVLGGLIAYLILILTLAFLIPYSRDGVAGVEAEGAVMVGAVFGLIGILGGNWITWLSK